MKRTEVRIVCDGESLCDGAVPSHSDRVTFVETMVKDARGWRAIGSPSIAAKRAAQQLAEERGIRLLPAERNAAGYDVVDDDDRHHKYDLLCSLCGYELDVRAERLHPVLDVIANAGVGSVSLRGLGARLQ
ncbi:hypothetical protein D0Z08_05890 [Nocardioides immobilis]|uniref:Uncharacterized protein n=1 Tax=Nocardioides immobilis TaxID=2049295 RepID=A0A417Y565_9ACTN|nr:hypothetical protein [Nocardioides immobilis]RHW27828.1 hypothetical protein D0Z08_05890 [Nocardioides immobilis]